MIKYSVLDLIIVFKGRLLISISFLKQIFLGDHTRMYRRDVITEYFKRSSLYGLKNFTIKGI